MSDAIPRTHREVVEAKDARIAHLEAEVASLKLTLERTRNELDKGAEGLDDHGTGDPVYALTAEIERLRAKLKEANAEHILRVMTERARYERLVKAAEAVRVQGVLTGHADHSELLAALAELREPDEGEQT